MAAGGDHFRGPALQFARVDLLVFLAHDVGSCLAASAHASDRFRAAAQAMARFATGIIAALATFTVGIVLRFCTHDDRPHVAHALCEKCYGRARREFMKIEAEIKKGEV